MMNGITFMTPTTFLSMPFGLDVPPGAIFPYIHDRYVWEKPTDGLG